MNITDEDAEDMAITENLQREDVAPLEEAAAFLRALKTGRHTVTTLVDKFGKSERYIRSHLKLNDLIEPLANLLEREEIIESMAIEPGQIPFGGSAVRLRRAFRKRRSQLVEEHVAPSGGSIPSTVT